MELLKMVLVSSAGTLLAIALLLLFFGFTVKKPGCGCGGDQPAVLPVTTMAAAGTGFNQW